MVVIGMFDGLHRGHQAVVAQALEMARALALPCTAVTFVQHPRTVLRPDHPVPLLTSWDEKQAALAALGLDRTVGIHFTDAFARLSPQEFAERILRGQLQARHVCVGYNFAFGHQQCGNGDTLIALGSELGFEVSVLPPVALGDDDPVSSSRIRRLLGTGEVDAARRLLGRPYELSGEVVPGDRRGRELGFPTANLSIPDAKLLPAHGVYAGYAQVDGQAHRCVLNLGQRPTFDPPELRVEAHLLDFSGDLYGRPLRLQLLHRLRAETAFPGVRELVAQIGADLAQARELLGEPLETDGSPANESRARPQRAREAYLRGTATE